MKLRTRVHERLAKGEPAFGAGLFLRNPEAAEFIAKDSPLDWFCVDAQHSQAGALGAVDLLRAVQAINPELTPFVRTPGQEKAWIEQLLDIGYVGLIVPLVESKEQAEELVRFACYPPLGKRSYGGLVRATLYGNYLESFNDHLILLPQVESRLGLEHCEAIVNVPGISGVLFGPGDLSLDMGWPLSEQWKSKRFIEAVEHIVDCCRRAGKIPATLLGKGDSAPAAVKLGITCLTMASDAWHMHHTMNAQVHQDLARLRAMPVPAAV